MKIIKFFTMILLLFVIACENGLDTPNSPEITSQENVNSNATFESLLEEQGLTALRLPVTNRSLSKKHIDVEEYTVEEGCFLKVKASYDLEDKEITIKTTLEVKPGALNEDKTLSMELDDELLAGDFDIVFGPHVDKFDPEALLNIKIKGLDLEDVEEEDLRLVYYNPNNGILEDMEYEKLVVKEDKGIIKLKNGKIPHFSRYALVR